MALEVGGVAARRIPCAPGGKDPRWTARVLPFSSGSVRPVPCQRGTFLFREAPGATKVALGQRLQSGVPGPDLGR